MTETLRDKLEGRDVMYRLGKVGIQTIRQPQKRMVELKDKTFEKVTEHGVYMRRMGDGRHSELTVPLDPTNPEHAELIDQYDTWLEEHPHKAVFNRISKVGHDRPVDRIQNWDAMTVEQVQNVVEAIKPDLLWCMEYELKRPEDKGGPREEVIELLEDLHTEGFTTDVEQSEEAPAL